MQKIIINENELNSIILNIISEYTKPYTQDELFDDFDNSYELIDSVLSKLNIIEDVNRTYFIAPNKKYAVFMFDFKSCIIYYDKNFMAELEENFGFKNLKQSISRWVNYNEYFVSCKKDPRFFVVTDKNIRFLDPY